MTREELIHEVFLKMKEKNKRLNKSVIDNILRYMADALTDGLERGERIRIVGFGTFEARMRPPYRRLNPRTKEEMIVEAKMVPIFKPGKYLRKAISKA